VTDAILADPGALAEHAAGWIAERIAASKGTFRFSLTGGSTPRKTYELLASRYRGQVEWSRVEFYWGDERFVSYDSPDSNYRLAHDTLLEPLGISAERIHPWPVGGTPEDSARDYEALLKRQYGEDRLDPGRPFFDLMLLGLGDDGHICSLFPGQESLRERERWALAVPTGRPEIRVTLTFPAVESSKATAFLVSGAGKSDAVRRVRAGDASLPGALLKPHGETFWLMDRAAAGLV
jgi:6-phosphogluconolactonase